MSSYVYLALLAVHVASLALFGGLVLATDLRLLEIGLRGYSVEEIVEGLRSPKRVGLTLAVLSGLALFVAHPEQYLNDGWFWAKIALLLLLVLNYAMFLRGLKRPRLAGGLSLLLWTAVVCAGRGPATIKDVMHSMVDPSGDSVFASVQEVGDEHGAHQQAPQTGEEWQDLRQRLEILERTPILVDGRRAARMRDRSRNPQSESQPEEIERALDTDRGAVERRARKLQNAAALAIRAVDARDTPALLRSIDSIDKACENCHLHYWYPNDKRARQAAKEDGVTDY